MAKMFNIFKKNGKKGTDQINPAAIDENYASDRFDDIDEGVSEVIVRQKRCSFTIGIQKITPIEDSEDLYVSGKVKGEVEVNTIAAICTFGDENKKVDYTTINELYINDDKVESAKDCYITARIERGVTFNARTGTVIYSRDMGEDPVHDSYVTAIGDYCVGEKKLDFTDEELEALSVTDASEVWRLYNWARVKKMAGAADDDENTAKEKLNKVAASLCDKLLKLDKLYVVYSKKTGEPHMFSRTVNRGDGTYMCTPPNIMLVTNAYHAHYEKFYNNDRFELKQLLNTEDGKGIYNFLGSIFYLNGACGVCINSDQISIAAGMLVEKPDYSKMDAANIPVTNPDLVRWLLLIGQLDMDKVDLNTDNQGNEADKEAADKEKNDLALIYKLYYRFLGIEMTKAKFIIPVKVEGNAPTPDSNGDVVLHRSSNFKLAVMKGKAEKPAVIMYTDWKNLRNHYGMEWNGLVQPMSEMLATFDCAVNPTTFPAAGCYINTEMYENMAKMAERDKK